MTSDGGQAQPLGCCGAALARLTRVVRLRDVAAGAVLLTVFSLLACREVRTTAYIPLSARHCCDALASQTSQTLLGARRQLYGCATCRPVATRCCCSPTRRVNRRARGALPSQGALPGD